MGQVLNKPALWNLKDSFIYCSELPPYNVKMISIYRSFILVLCFCLSIPAMAGDDHDKARKALESGQVLPLQQILQKISKDYPAQVIEVDLERKKDGWIYEIKQLGADGSLSKLEVDAKTGIVLKQKSKK